MRMLLRIDSLGGSNLGPRHVAGTFRACGLDRCQCVRVQPSVGFTVAVGKRETAGAVVINARVIAPDDRIKYYQEITVVQGRWVFIQKHKRLGWRRPKDLRQLSKGEIRLNGLVRVPTVPVHVPVQRDAAHARPQYKVSRLGYTLIGRAFIDPERLVII